MLNKIRLAALAAALLIAVGGAAVPQAVQAQGQPAAPAAPAAPRRRPPPPPPR